MLVLLSLKTEISTETLPVCFLSLVKEGKV